MADSEEVKPENDTSSQDKVENTEVEAEVISTSDKCTKKDVIVTDSDAKSKEPIENHEETKMIKQGLKPESSKNTEPKGTAEDDLKESNQEQEKSSKGLKEEEISEDLEKSSEELEKSKSPEKSTEKVESEPVKSDEKSEELEV